MNGPVDAPPVYAEPARGFRSLVWSVLAVAAGFCVDLALGVHGAITHLPGWLGAGVILVGGHVLVLRAVRATKSLTLTADELAVGDEAVVRGQIVGVTPGGGPGVDLPALGWPNGFPRGTKALTIRLEDDRDVLVPTRFPARLQAALALGIPVTVAEPEVRVAEPDDLPALPDIDDRAEALYRVAGYALPEIASDVDGVRDARLVLVVGRPPVGFVQVDEVDGQAHVSELSVLPGAMRRGHGTELLERACAWARTEGYRAITLTTYAEVPWNGPFYAARGFVVDDEPGPGVSALRDREQALGLDAVGRRVVMRRELSFGSSNA